jgi:hypothetical protein
MDAQAGVASFHPGLAPMFFPCCSISIVRSVSRANERVHGLAHPHTDCHTPAPRRLLGWVCGRDANHSTTQLALGVVKARGQLPACNKPRPGGHGMTEPSWQGGLPRQFAGRSCCFLPLHRCSMETAEMDYRGMSHGGAPATCNRAWELQICPKAKATEE